MGHYDDIRDEIESEEHRKQIARQSAKLEYENYYDTVESLLVLYRKQLDLHTDHKRYMSWSTIKNLIKAIESLEALRRLDGR